MVQAVNGGVKLKKILNCFDNYSMLVEYDNQSNSLVITSTNHTTGESMVNVQPGNIGNLVKFDQSTVDSYVSQAWGGALPAYDNKIGFIFNQDDLDIRKHLLTDAEYADILNKFPKLVQRHDPLDLSQIRLVSAVKSQELDILTGKPKEGSTATVYVDNEIQSWYSKSSVPTVDATAVLPDHMIKMLGDTSQTPPIYVDPIQRDIWKKYGNCVSN